MNTKSIIKSSVKLLAVGSIAFSAAVFSSCADGSAVRIGPTLAPTNAQNVRVLLDQPKGNYTNLGIVESEMPEVLFTSRAKTAAKAVEELKVQAAKLGANAVLIKNYNTNTNADVVLDSDDSISGVLNTDIKRLSGTAILIK